MRYIEKKLGNWEKNIKWSEIKGKCFHFFFYFFSDEYLYLFVCTCVCLYLGSIQCMCVCVCWIWSKIFCFVFTSSSLLFFWFQNLLSLPWYIRKDIDDICTKEDIEKLSVLPFPFFSDHNYHYYHHHHHR